MRPTPLAVAAVLVVAVPALADGPSPAAKRAADAAAARDRAVAKAAADFWAATAAADKRLVDALTSAGKAARGDDAKAIADQLAAAQDRLADDQQAVAEHRRLPEVVIGKGDAGVPRPQYAAMAVRDRSTSADIAKARARDVAASKYLQDHPKLSPSLVDAICQGQVAVGLPADALTIVTIFHNLTVRAQDSDSTVYHGSDLFGHELTFVVRDGKVDSITYGS